MNIHVDQNNARLFSLEQVFQEVKNNRRERKRKNAPLIMMKKEADSCGLKLSDAGRAMMKEFLDVNSEDYVHVFKRQTPVNGILKFEKKEPK